MDVLGLSCKDCSASHAFIIALDWHDKCEQRRAIPGFLDAWAIQFPACMNAGQGVLEDVALRPGAFDYLKLPIAIQEGRVGKLKIQVGLFFNPANVHGVTGFDRD